MLWFACIVSVFGFIVCREKSEISQQKAIEELYEKFEILQEELLNVNQRLVATEKVLAVTKKENQEMKSQIEHLRDENYFCRKHISSLEFKINQVVKIKENSGIGKEFIDDKVSNFPHDLAKDTIVSGQRQPDLQKRLFPDGTPMTYTQPRIAFSVSLTRDVSLGYHQTIDFDRIITNIGNVYDPNDGHFIAPYKGIYLLTATITNHEGHTQNVEMVRNGIQITALLSDGDDWNMSAQTILVLLEQNDKIWLRAYRQNGLSQIAADKDAPFCTFSGVLLFEM